MIINVVLFFILGTILAVMGFPLTTWQFWVVMAIAAGIQANNTLRAQT